MLLKNKMHLKTEQNWSVVLKSIKNEIDKKKIIQTLTKVFPLSASEAADLVVNTPIILLDNLSQLQANRFREFFSFGNQFLMLTNDVFYKRRCYKTVWPEDPDLSFLDRSHQTLPVEKTSQKEAVSPDEALEKIKGFSIQDDVSAFDQTSHQNHREVHEELEQWKQECLRLRALTERLQEEASRRLQNFALPQRPNSEADRQTKELKAALLSTNEKYEALREEYREVRSVLEGKLVAAQKATESWQIKLENIQKLSRDQQEQKKQVELLLEQMKREKGELAEQKRKTEAELYGKETHLQSQVHELKQKIEDAQKQNQQKESWMQNQTAEYQKQRQDMQEKINSLESQLQIAVHELKTAHRQTEDKYAEAEKLQQTIAELQAKIHSHEQETHRLFHEKENLQAQTAAFAKKQEDISSAHQKQIEGFQTEITELQKALEGVHSEKQRFDDERKHLEHEIEELESSRELVNQALRELELQYQDLVKRYGELRLDFERDQKKYEADRAQWEMKEKDLSARLENSDQDKEHLERILGEKAEQVSSWREKSEMAIKQFEELQKVLENERANYAELSGTCEALKRDCENLTEDLALRQKEVGSWTEKFELTSKKLHGLEDLCAQQSEELQKQNTVLEMREKELDVLRKQLRHIQEQLEQRDMIQKRIQLTSLLSEKESQLKILVKEQERVESEIREREESIRRILTQQEGLEHEIVEAKQTQRHLLEQVKRDKTVKSPLTNRSNHESDPHR